MADNKSGLASQEEQQLDTLVVQAVDAAAKGESIEQLLEVMLASIPSHLREKLRSKFSAALEKRKLRQPSKDADIASHTALARIRDIFAVTTRQAFDRIAALVRSRPDIASAIEQAGKMLMRNGVVADKLQVSEADLGAMSPSAGIAQAPQNRATTAR